MPTFIRALRGLRTLYLSSNSFRGDLPDFITTLTRVECVRVEWSPRVNGCMVIVHHEAPNNYNKPRLLFRAEDHVARHHASSLA